MGSGSGSTKKMERLDPDPYHSKRKYLDPHQSEKQYPDPNQRDADPQHWLSFTDLHPAGHGIQTDLLLYSTRPYYQEEMVHPIKPFQYWCRWHHRCKIEGWSPSFDLTCSGRANFAQISMLTFTWRGQWASWQYWSQYHACKHEKNQDQDRA